MRDERPSQTSSLVTLMRALAHGGVTEVQGFEDPTALVLLPPAWRLLARSLLWRVGPLRVRQFMIDQSFGRMDVVALRTRVLDEAWGVAHDQATRQLVLLGAGLDGRAFRLPNLADAAVFEVDHPSTQALKRERAAALRSLAGRHLFVPVNFETDALGDALAKAGHQPGAPTFWIWEGVTHYLTAEAQAATLAALAARSAPGSRVAMNYIEPGQNPLQKATVPLLVRMLGEPFLGQMPRAVAAERLERAGFSCVEDTGLEDWRRRYSQNPERASTAYAERIALGEKRPA